MEQRRPCDRLKWAREKKQGIPTATQAARYLDVATPTYLSHENGTRKISPEWADFYAQKFGISPTWLLYERGAPDEENTFVATVATPTSPSAQRKPARLQGGNPLLTIFEVNYAPDGALRPLPGVSNVESPAWLPTLSAANGFIAELVQVQIPERESRRLIRIPDAASEGAGAPEELLFGLDDFVRLPPDMVHCEMAFAIRIRNADLIDSASGYDRAIIDATDRFPYKGGYYYVLLNRRAALVYLVPFGEDDLRNRPSRVRIFETRFDEPKEFPIENVHVIGKVIVIIMAISEQLRSNLVKPLELAFKQHA